MFRFIQTHKTFFLSIGFFVVFAETISYATPPSTPYTAGETLDPACAPGGANCSVVVIGGVAPWGGITGTLSNQSDLQSALNAKEPLITATTTSQYLRGDKTFQNLDTSVVPESGNLYLTTGRVQSIGDGRYPQLSGSYVDPSWLVSFDGSKLTGTVTANAIAAGTYAVDISGNAATATAAANATTVTNGLYSTGSYANPSWIASLSGGKLTGTVTANAIAAGSYAIDVAGNAATVTNGIYTTGTYANPSWITSLAFSKIANTPTTLSGYGITDAAPLSGSANYIQNTSSPQTSSFNITGSGTVGGTLAATTVTGAITPTGFTAGSLAFGGSGGTIAQDNSYLFYDSTNHRLGIGTASPSSQSIVDIRRTITDTTTSQRAARTDLTINAAGASNVVYAAQFANVKYNASSTVFANGSVSGILAQADLTGSGRVNQTQGVLGIATTTGTNTVNIDPSSSLYGGRFYSQNNGAGHVGHLVGVKIGQQTNNGLADKAFGLYVMDQINPGSGTTTASSAIHIEGAGANNAIRSSLAELL